MADTPADHSHDPHAPAPAAGHETAAHEHAPVAETGAAVAGHAAHEGTAAAEGHHGGGHHEFTLGRHVAHPPEPPQIFQVLYLMEQEGLINSFMARNPSSERPAQVEEWLAPDAHGHLAPVEGKSPTLLQTLHYGRASEPLPIVNYLPWENHVFLGLVYVIVILGFWLLTSQFRANRREAMRKPNRCQVLIETVVGGFDDFCKGILGEENGRRYFPFVGTLFITLLVGNFMGMVPLMKPPTSSLVITFSFALCTFIVVQLTAWFKLGPLSYIHHLLGSPKDIIGWALSPLFLLLEMISDFGAKPLSLSLRLFGNMLGKEILFGAFLLMGISLSRVLLGPVGDFIGIPLTIPFYALGILLSTIQALVFSLLSTIYIMMVLPHDHEHHDEDHGHGNAHGAHDHGHDHHHHAAPAAVAVHEAVPH